MSKASRVTTGKVRLIFTALAQARENKNGKMKYSCRMAIPKEDEKTLDALRAAIAAAYEDGIEKLKGKAKVAPPLDKLDDPIHDGDIERPDDPACENCWYLNASTDYIPDFYVKDDEGQYIEIDPDNFYSGCYARVCVNFYAYNVTGGRGIACGLNSLLFMGDGEKLGGHANPNEDFG